MKNFVFLAVILIAVRLNYARAVFSSAENDVYVDDFDQGDDEYDVYPNDSPKDLDDSDDHSIIKKDDLTRQIIFNPQKRRERRLNRIAAYNEMRSIDMCWNKRNECENIKPNESRGGLLNKETRAYWHCDCENELYECLHRLNSTISNNIGNIHSSYYNRCYRNEHHIQKCNVYDYYTGTEKRCVQYLLYINTQKKTQWFDVPFYSGKAVKKPLFVIKN